MKRKPRSFSVFCTLGPSVCLKNGIYRLLLKAGYYKQVLPFHRFSDDIDAPAFVPLPMPGREDLLPYLEADRNRIEQRFSELRQHLFRPFSGEKLVELSFVPVNGNRHWAVRQKFPVEDPKLIWEPARFCWVTDLLRYEALTMDGKADLLFTELLDTFMEKNPINGGENWESAQEVGLRLINIALFGSVMLALLEEKAYTEAARKTYRPNLYRKKLGAVLYEHAKRIPPTLIYAESQRNNHLLSESAALMTAAVVLPDAEESEEWFRIGWETLCRGLKDQFNTDGVYIQQSTNYLRLVLTLIIWSDLLLRLRDLSWPEELIPRLRRAVMRLFECSEAKTGCVCNTGHNDGTLFLSFGSDYADYRPVMQAYSGIFLRKRLFKTGSWDEMGTWLNVHPRGYDVDMLSLKQGSLLRINSENGFALLRTASFFGRPAHDDLLHTDIWLDGVNECMDGGTYRYSAEDSLWQNPFKDAFHHNVLTVDDRSPMTNAGKFMWLDWDSCKVITSEPDLVCAERFAYRCIGLRHIRRLSLDEGFSVEDEIIGVDPDDRSAHRFRLHWLLPDQAFSFSENVLTLERISLAFECAGYYKLRILRGGECVFDSSYGKPCAEDGLLGWVSPTYNQKKPALSVILTAESAIPYKICTKIMKN